MSRSFLIVSVAGKTRTQASNYRYSISMVDTLSLNGKSENKYTVV